MYKQFAVDKSTQPEYYYRSICYYKLNIVVVCEFLNVFLLLLLSSLNRL